MSEGQLEQVMIDFWSGEYDVMVATTIIESGLDLPKVNTLIVERADLLGLAQLYQLRGRVGRSDQRAYAYLFHPADQSLTEERTGGWRRSGRRPIWDRGSSWPSAISRSGVPARSWVRCRAAISPRWDSISTPSWWQRRFRSWREGAGDHRPKGGPHRLACGRPFADAYVADQELRLEAYRRLATTTTNAEVDDVASEWVDRFGPLPPEAEALISLARLRVEALRVGLEELVQLRHEVRMGPVDLKSSQEVRLKRLQPRSVLNAQEGVIFIRPRPGPGADHVPQ